MQLSTLIFCGNWFSSACTRGEFHCSVPYCCCDGGWRCQPIATTRRPIQKPWWPPTARQSFWISHNCRGLRFEPTFAYRLFYKGSSNGPTTRFAAQIDLRRTTPILIATHWPWYVPDEIRELIISASNGCEEMFEGWTSVSLAWRIPLSVGLRVSTFIACPFYMFTLHVGTSS